MKNNLTNAQKSILKIIQENQHIPRLTAKSIGKMLNKDAVIIRNHLNKMKDIGILVRKRENEKEYEWFTIDYFNNVVRFKSRFK